MLTTGPKGKVSHTNALLGALANHPAMVGEKFGSEARSEATASGHEDTVRPRADEIQRKEQEYRMLLEISRAVSAHLDRKDLFHAIANAVRPAAPFDRLGIVLPRGGEDALVFYAFETHDESKHLLPGSTIPRAGSVPGWVLEHERPLLASTTGELSPFPVSLDMVTKEGMQSLCALPLLTKKRAVGAMLLFGKERGLYGSKDIPFLEEVAAAVAVALDNCLAYEEIRRLKDRLSQENIYLREEINAIHNFEEIIGTSTAIKEVFQSIERVAATDASVLLTGETGTGKELVAAAIHNLSNRRDRMMVKVSCVALPASLIESELFGHEKGAFTGALSRKIGRFELASGGTILLDEIGDLPFELQAKILRVLQEGEFERVGGSRTLKVDFRVIAATNRDLERAVQEGGFRADLYYRLNVFPIRVPSLRERREDIPHLVRHFAMKYGLEMGKRIEAISQETMDALQSYAWPGNIRELENVMERAVLLTQGPRIELGEWFPSSRVEPPGTEIKTLEELERGHILKALESTGWRVSGERGAAKLLGLKPTTLGARMKKLGIQKGK